MAALRPFDSTFRDLYGVLDYFARDEREDAAARLIAEQGRAWSQRVLRRVDMRLYVWRLLLEFARICDENRERLGYVNDLLGKEDEIEADGWSFPFF